MRIDKGRVLGSLLSRGSVPSALVAEEARSEESTMESKVMKLIQNEMLLLFRELQNGVSQD